MNITEVKANIKNGAYDNSFSMLYGDVSAARARYLRAVSYTHLDTSAKQEHRPSRQARPP